MRVPALLAIFVLGSVSVFAGEQDAPRPQLRYGELIGSDDTITIVALDAEEISKTWRVGSNGDLNLPMVGKIHAAGMTVVQFEDELVVRLKRFIRDPHVTVYISEFRSQPVTVAGAVEKPGTIQLEGPKTLLGVLMMAGGPKMAGPTVTITRSVKRGRIPLPGAREDSEGKYNIAELNLREVTDASSEAANLILQPEDVVTVSSQQKLVYVIGEVNRPGAVELVTQDSVSVVQVVAAAGGLTRGASPGKTAILRLNHDGLYTKIASVDVKKMMTGEAKDIKLTAGDIMVVPSSQLSQLKLYLQAASLSAATASVYILGRF